MSNSDFDKFFDGDWEDTGDLDWNESDWNKFLVSIDQSVQEFTLKYKELSGQKDRLDHTAFKMGWSALDWDQNDSERQSDALIKAFENFMNLEEDETFNEPLSLNKHPAFIAIEGLIHSLLSDLEKWLHTENPRITALDIFRLSNCLHKMELESILGVNALDLGDLTLAIAHLKRSLLELNKAFSFIGTIKNNKFQQESYAHLFDLRELWLRVIQDCKRKPFDQDDSFDFNDEDEDDLPF
jgi:hypothetical protein